MARQLNDVEWNTAPSDVCQGSLLLEITEVCCSPNLQCLPNSLSPTLAFVRPSTGYHGSRCDVLLGSGSSSGSQLDLKSPMNRDFYLGQSSTNGGSLLPSLITRECGFGHGPFFFSNPDNPTAELPATFLSSTKSGLKMINIWLLELQPRNPSFYILKYGFELIRTGIKVVGRQKKIVLEEEKCKHETTLRVLLWLIRQQHHLQ